MNRVQGVAISVAIVAMTVVVTTGDTATTVTTHGTIVVQLLAAYAFLLATSGFVVSGALHVARIDPLEEDVDTGRAVGKIENVLVLTLTLLGAFTALAIVFTAKSIVRWQDLSSGNTTYYLTGSIANVTYSFVYGLVIAVTLDAGAI